MSYKRLIPCIFIYKGKAIKWFDDKEVVSDDVIGLAKQYCDKGADELIVFDLSNTDDEHDEAIDLMKKVNRAISIPRRKCTQTGRREKDSVHRCKTGNPEFFQTAVV